MKAKKRGPLFFVFYVLCFTYQDITVDNALSFTCLYCSSHTTGISRCLASPRHFQACQIWSAFLVSRGGCSHLAWWTCILKNFQLPVGVMTMGPRTMCRWMKSLGCSVLGGGIPWSTNPLGDASLGRFIPDRCFPNLDRIKVLVVTSQSATIY